MIRRAMVALALSATLVALAGCTTTPPEPTPTPAFASEAEAFAAAEETYRAYVDALNAVDLSDPATFEAVYAWLDGEAAAEARESFSEMHADRLTVSGSSVPTVVVAQPTDVAEFESMAVAICVDVSSVELVDATGQSVVSADRPDVQSMLVTMTPSSSSPTRLAIVAFEGRSGDPLCG